MKFAVFYDASIKDGGSYHFFLKTIDILKKVPNLKGEIIYICSNLTTYEYLQKKNINCIFYKPNFLDRIFFLIFSSNFLKLIIKKFKILSRFENFLGKNGVNLIYFIGASNYSFMCQKIDYINYIFEVHHLFRPDLPEYKSWYDFDLRETLIKNIVKKSLSIVVDTNKKKEYLIKYYNCIEKKIDIVPLSSNLIDLKNNPNDKIDEKIEIFLKKQLKFYFYPAQYWSLKNHIYILDTIKHLKEKHNLLINFVFTGQKKNNFDFIYNKAKNYGILDNIFFYEYVSNSSVVSLFKNCEGMVMPTLVGNASLPLYESFYYKTSVFYTKGLLDNDIINLVTEFDIDEVNDLANILKDKHKIQLELDEKKELAYNYYNSNYREEHLVEKYEKLIKKIKYQKSLYS